MKIEFLSSEKFKKNTLPDEKFSFGVELPFSKITLPSEKKVFFAWQRNCSCSYMKMDMTAGTVIMCRVDYKDKKIFNYDVCSVLLTAEKEILKIKKIKKYKIEGILYHHYHGIPLILEGQAPKWVKDKVADIIKKQKNEL